MHRVDELLQRYRSGVVLVEDLKNSLVEEGLRRFSIKFRPGKSHEPYILRNDDLLKVISFDFLSLADSLLE